MSAELLAALERAEAEARSALAVAETVDAVDGARIAQLGRKSPLSLLLREVGRLPADQRGVFGKRANQVRAALETAFDERRADLARRSAGVERDFEPTTPGRRPPRGHRHPVLAMRAEIEDIFLSMGFQVLDGPEVESEHYNFEALNIPEHHPARDLQDTFFVAGDGPRRVLRTHTSPMQVRALERHGAPLRVIVPGRVYRCETLDASHESCFHQVEGLVVDRRISVAHLKGVMAAFLGRLFGRAVEVRLRPHYFPFVEPGFELDFRCTLCSGGGCAVCRRTGWIEMLGCGMVHPRVLAAGGVDAEEFGGFAFGVGLERLAMMRHGIEDIRHFHGGDLRFFEQF